MQNIVPRYDPEYNEPKGTVLRKNWQVINLVRLLFNHIGLKGNSRLQPPTSDQKVRFLGILVYISTNMYIDLTEWMRWVSPLLLLSQLLAMSLMLVREGADRKITKGRNSELWCRIFRLCKLSMKITFSWTLSSAGAGSSGSVS